MDLPRENINRTEIENLKYYSQFMYINGGEINVNSNENSCYEKKDSDSFQNIDTKDFSSRLDNKNTFIILPNQYNDLVSGSRNAYSRDSFESICSRNLRTETKYYNDIYDKSKLETHQNDSGKKSIDDTHSNFTLNNPNRVSDDSEGITHKKLYFDKTTYCRPVLNLYNQEFLYKTMQKNAKLRKIVTQLAFARQKEKEVVNWKNYINDLRKKHGRDLNVKCGTSQLITNEHETTDAIEDVYNTKFACKQSDPCQHLLQDFYKSHDIKASIGNNYKTCNEYAQTSRVYNPFKTNPLCFPTSSQGRIIMLERERMKRLMNRGYKPGYNTINEEKSPERSKTDSRKGFGPKKCSFIRNSRSTNTSLQSISTQTESPIAPSKSVNELLTKGCNTSNLLYEKKVTKEVRDKETTNFYSTNNILRKNSLVCIEEKLDNLIHSINNFITEMKTKSDQHKCFNQNTILRDKNVNYTRSDSCNMARKEKIVCGYMDDSSRTTRNSSMDNFNRKQTIDDNLTDILWKEIERNKAMNLKCSSIKEIYHPCSVQISVTIPTKEISTEVTRSLSKAGNLETRNVVIEEIPRREEDHTEKKRREDRRIAIAVNTDPLSLLAMLRVSTEETVRRLLSYVPSIDYYSYLARLQGPSTRVVESHYVCNICGAAFMKPSALTDHIKKHELGDTRDCCVCRHVLDLPRRRPGLFKCQYCGQRFTRAYCCELHQEACARRLGKLHDVRSSLMLLR